MVLEQVSIKKRYEDISYSFEFLNSKGVFIRQFFKNGKNYFNAAWFIICNEFNDTEKSNIFQKKVEDFFLRNLIKLGIENYILAFVPKNILDEEKNKFFSSLMLISPSGKFLIFCQDNQSSQTDFPNKIGKAEFIYFGSLLEVLSNKDLKRDFLKTLKKIANSLQPT
ncbi:MAG: hypothetical protein N2440_00855 [Actinobacteria bacterium]|nr:hypothetical protein [Actinomycetota bacterium]